MTKSELRVSTPTINAEPAEGLTIERLKTIVQDSRLSFLRVDLEHVESRHFACGVVAQRYRVARRT